MYHLFVIAKLGGWDHGFYQFDRSRFLEYTNEAIGNAFDILTETHIQTLLSWPCLFAYEGEEHEVRVGSLTSIKQQGRYIRIEFEFSNYPPIQYVDIKPIAPLLDIRDWEMNRTHWAIKEEDLLQRLRDANLLGQVGVLNPQDVQSSIDQLMASPFELISSVGEFIEKILEVQHGGNEVFYRGHSSKGAYKLEPSLFRKDSHGNYLHLENEHNLYRELLVSNSIDFDGDNCTFDRLVRMQHYSLPTRLLDITSNPLIALYFACKSKPSVEGEVIILSISRKTIKYFDSDTVSCIANLVRLQKNEKDSVDHEIEGAEQFNNQQPIKRLIHFVKEEKSFFESRIEREHLRSIVCVKGKRSNDRISSQSGAFLLFGLDAVLNESGTPEIKVERFTVSNKEEILRQLDLLNINESTVFPYIENSAKYIADKYSFKIPAITL